MSPFVELDEYLDADPGERPPSEPTPNHSGAAAPQGVESWLYDEQICRLREARSLLRSVLHDVATVRSLRQAQGTDQPTPHAVDLEALLKQADDRLWLLTTLRHQELNSPRAIASAECSGCDSRGLDVRQETNGDLVCRRCGRMVSPAGPPPR